MILQRPENTSEVLREKTDEIEETYVFEMEEILTDELQVRETNLTYIKHMILFNMIVKTLFKSLLSLNWNVVLHNSKRVHN